MLWNVFPKLWHISHRRVSETPLRAVCPFLKHHTGKLSYPWSITEFRNELVSQWASLVAQTVTNLPAMQETQVQSLGQEDSLEKGMATHSSILDWRIPWTEEPGRLQSMGLQRVGHDWAINTHTHTHIHSVPVADKHMKMWGSTVGQPRHPPEWLQWKCLITLSVDKDAGQLNAQASLVGMGNRPTTLASYLKVSCQIKYYYTLSGPSVPLLDNPQLKWVLTSTKKHMGFPGGSDSKESACNAGEPA